MEKRGEVNIIYSILERLLGFFGVAKNSLKSNFWLFVFFSKINIYIYPSLSLYLSLSLHRHPKGPAKLKASKWPYHALSIYPILARYYLSASLQCGPPQL